jgi:hypothetical protein
VEEYGLDVLAASAEGVLAGLGPLVAGLARLAGEACGAVTLDAMEVLVLVQGRELLRGLAQLGLDAQAAAEVRLAGVTGADGVWRGRAERGHSRVVVTRLGAVTVRRIGYRSGVKGVLSLFPRDAVLNLPPAGYSWQLQALAEMSARAGSYGDAQELVAAATGVSIGKRQLEQVIAGAAADEEPFRLDRLRDQEHLTGDGDGDGDGDGRPGGRPGLQPLVISADGKGVAMRPEARRSRARTPGNRARTFRKRRGTGEKTGHKRMAETGCVFDVRVPDGPARTAEQIMHPDPDPRARPAAPHAVNRWYTADITAGRAVTISRLFDEAGHRDPGHARTWIALVDGDNTQLALIQAEAARCGVPVTMLIDFIHVLEYLWKTAWCFHQPRDPAAEDWVTGQAASILDGRVTDVITLITQLAGTRPPPAGSEHARTIRRTLHYLNAKKPYLDYPAALAAGWPIATGVIEGACRHLVQDRMGITGARWGLKGAQAMLTMRALHASGDLAAYWNYHIQQEHQRNHLSRYKDTCTLAA